MNDFLTVYMSFTTLTDVSLTSRIKNKFQQYFCLLFIISKTVVQIDWQSEKKTSTLKHKILIKY